ncbi:MAG: hypothetical protein QHH24_03105 [Candidatus Bathyarchaeota archaeon]|nr:hypothetical protein [Candidatus Bathyarchaeota archaeon]
MEKISLKPLKELSRSTGRGVDLLLVDERPVKANMRLTSKAGMMKAATGKRQPP